MKSNFLKIITTFSIFLISHIAVAQLTCDAIKTRWVDETTLELDIPGHCNKRKWIYAIGTHYTNRYHPKLHGLGANAQVWVRNQQAIVFHMNFQWETNRLSTQDQYYDIYDVSGSYHFKKTPFFVGGALQLIDIKNSAIVNARLLTPGLSAHVGVHHHMRLAGVPLITTLRVSFGGIHYYNNPKSFSGTHITVALPLNP